MLTHTKITLQGILPKNTQYLTFDVQNIPFPNDSFDIVIANHMLYHVPCISQAIAEIHRVLNSGGVLYANTNGKNHFLELYDLIKKFHSGSESHESLGFSLENGLDMVKIFTLSELLRYEDSLEVTDAKDLLLYQLSLSDNSESLKDSKKQEQLLHFFHSIIKEKGCIKITKDAGMIKAIK